MSTSEDSVNEELGLSENGSTDTGSEQNSGEDSSKELPEHFKARLGKVEKRYKRDVSDLRAEVANLRSQLRPDPQMSAPMHSEMNPVSPDEDSRIAHAVEMRFKQKEQEAQQAAHQENQQFVAKHYNKFSKSLEDAADEYDDFEDVTRDHQHMFTPEMMTVASILPPKLATNVVYHLGKNPEDLKRINSLHPLDQGGELVKIALSLHAGDAAKSAKTDDGILSNMKTNSSSASSGKNTSDVQTLRQRMLEGNFK